jgi:cbb3-type cytochrome oxidase maturation protein
MWSTYLLIFLMLCIGVAGWLLFIWAVKSGQYDDVEGPKYRMLDDDEQVTPSPDTSRKQHPPVSEHPAGRNGGDGTTSPPS